jgi:integrase
MSDEMTGTGLSRTPRGDREEADELPTFSPSGAGETVLTAAEVGQVVAALEASRSPATRRAYATAWRQWCEWTSTRGASPMPADPVLVAAYVAGLAEAGRAMSTIDRALSAISAAHRDAGNELDPTRHPGVIRVRAGLRRTIGVAPKRLAYPISTEELRRVVEAIPDDLRGARDRALILTGFAGALRRSEVVALTLGDLTFHTKGAVLLIRRSKTDQEGEGQHVGIARGTHPSTDPVAALRRWVDLAQLSDADDPLFGPISWSGRRSRPSALSGRDVARILQARASAAGLGDLAVRGHSLRAGHATEAAARGVPADRLARTTRHKSTAALARYVRPTEALSDTSSADLGL